MLPGSMAYYRRQHRDDERSEPAARDNPGSGTYYRNPEEVYPPSPGLFNDRRKTGALRRMWRRKDNDDT